MLDKEDREWIREMLAVSVIAPLLDEIGSVRSELGQFREEVNARLNSIDARLKLQAGLIQSGMRAMARFSEFAENSEQRWVDLERRVRALEEKQNRQQKDGPPA